MKNMSLVHLTAIKYHKIQLQNYQKYTFFDIPSQYLFSLEKLASEKMHHRILLKNEIRQCSGMCRTSR